MKSAQKSAQKSAHPRPDSTEKHVAPYHRGVLQLDRPMFLRQLCTDEYTPQPYTEADRRVVRRTQTALDLVSKDRRVPVSALAGERTATAAGLRALNAEYGPAWGGDFYHVPDSATMGEDEAAEAFAGDELVVDVQTHFMAPHSMSLFQCDWLRDLLRQVMPPWWRDLDAGHAWDLSYYLTNVYLRTDTTVAVLTSSPGTTDLCPLFNDEIHATRTLVDNLAGVGRLLNHAVVHAEMDAQREQMTEMAERYDPVGWKVYTMGAMLETGWTDPWRLDDEKTGIPFLTRCRELGKKLICTHKGLSQFAQNGDPYDVGPAAKMFPDIDFVVYHSGFEFPVDGAPEEGPYTEATRDIGCNRMIATLEENGIGHGSNVYGELGSTWYSVVRNPVAAAHVMGKLIKAFGVDNIIWGTDSVWYGGSQPLIDAFRTFQIPDRMCEEFGYAKITPADKEKILGLNACRVYDIDAEAMKAAAKDDDLAWARQAVDEYRKKQFPGVR
jgi:hypothetical protein